MCFRFKQWYIVVTHAFGGLGLRSTFLIARMSSLGSAQCSRGFSPGTERFSSLMTISSRWLVDRAVVETASRADERMGRSFIVSGSRKNVVSEGRGRAKGWQCSGGDVARVASR